MVESETYPVYIFHEVFSHHDDMEHVQENMRTRLESAKLDIEDATFAINYHPTSKVFVCIISVIPT